MNGLSGTRVIVVDDDENDALPVLKAFARKGISAAYFDGSKSQLPLRNEGLTGVRLAILDMDLIGGGASEKAKAAALVARLERIISAHNGPYIAVLWTNQPELQNQFEDYAFSSATLPNPVISILLTKAECKTASGKFSLSTISQKLEQALNETGPLRILQLWEEKSFQAAADVSNSLSRLAEPDAPTLTDWRTQWKIELLKLMHAMAVADMGKNLVADCCTSAVFNALNPLHADRVESYSATLAPSLTQSSREIMATPVNTTLRQRAEVNTMLHLAFDRLDHFSPGNVYVFARKTLPPWIATNKELLTDIAEAQITSDNRRILSNAARRVVLEISAVCDHAQGNIRIPRFVEGLLVPASQKKRIRVAAFIFPFGPVYLKRPVSPTTGEYYVYFSARHQITRTKDELTDITAVARLRGQALSDIQAWFSRQSSRPGVVMLSN